MEDKSAYPYITQFKKEPFKSFITIKRKEIKSFYFKNYNKLISYYQYFNENLLTTSQLNLETIFWFLLLRKYLKEDNIVNREDLFKFIKNCEVPQHESVGFKLSPYSDDLPDIYSTYLALSCLNILGLLKEYLFSEKQNQIKLEIKNFVLAHKQGNKFLHCLKKECETCKNYPPAKILYYVLEIFSLLGVDVRNNRDQFRSFLSDRKKDSSLAFRLLCLKYLDLEYEVKDKELQFLQQQQHENGGFSFNQDDNIDTTFWLGYTLEVYSWLLNYNPTGIYSYINQKLGEILTLQENPEILKLKEVSKLIALLSLIWRKFIDEIERVIFKQIEKENYIDVNQLKTTFGFTEYIEDIISYINLNYNFDLQIVDNEVEFKNYINTLSQGKKTFLEIFYEKLKNNSIISLTDLSRRYRIINNEPIRLREEIFPIIKDMVEKRFFIGNIRTKKVFLGFKTKYLFYLNYLLKRIIISDMNLNTENIYEEKEKIEDIRNDIYNLTLKLNGVISKIKEEIESYLLIDEIEYAKDRLKFILRDALMEADFLNENIESSFNEILKYINIQASLGAEIAQWNKLYSVLQKKLSDVGAYLQSKIQEKEDLRNLDDLLENLKEKIRIIEEDLQKRLDSFRKVFSETFEKEFDNAQLNLIIQDLDNISQNVKKYDNIIFNVSQKVTTKEKKIIKKHKKIIDNWVGIKEHFNIEFNYYIDGFQFFNTYMQKVEDINKQIKLDIIEINNKAKTKILESAFHEAFNITKKETDLLLNKRLSEIKELQSLIKQEIKKKQKLYVLHRHLQDKLDLSESNTIELFANQVKVLKNKIIEERNRSKLEDFDNSTSQNISNLKSQLNDIKRNLNISHNLTIDDVIKKFDQLKSDYDTINKIFVKKLNDCNKNIDNFKEKSELSIIQWEKFSDFFLNEISISKDEYINRIISSKLNIMAIEKKTNNIKLVDLKDEIKLSCKILISRLKDMIDVSKINAELNEEDKSIFVYTDDYYLNKELKNYIDNNLLKFNREKVGKILNLYDSSIRNLTLNINMLELQNRINDLRIFKDVFPKQFHEKVQELQINQERVEFIETKNYFESILENERAAINRIKKSLKMHNEMQSFINQQFNSLNIELKSHSDKVFKETESYDKYLKIQENFESNQQKINEELKRSQDKIEEKINTLLNKSGDSSKLVPEIRELYVKSKNEFISLFNSKTQKINDYLTLMKSESFREQLVNLINKKKIHLSQLLGNLERKVEDNIEIKEFKKCNVLIQKRAKSIELEIKDILKIVDNKIKEFTKQSKNFNQTSKFILDDFNKFIDDYSEILAEKVRNLERLILKSYIDMTIKAVANEYLTLGFLNNELKIKKQNVQDHLLYLISEGELKGKFDPRFSIYFENPEILDELDETEIEVIKSSNYKLQMLKRNLRNFASQYGGIIAFFSSIIAITYYLFIFSGANPTVFAFPIIIT
ncbi:MAG: hypothetical protein R3255_03765, partial [Candidatus Lokiarchaeia archaeon]|nr:hypothetical protein [Candidatus Lokiarchaeia archaeon]